MSNFVYEFPSYESLKVSEDPVAAYGGKSDYTAASLSKALGTAEWFLAYTFQANGVLEGSGESSTYSISISPDGRARVTSYNLTKDRTTGKLLTLEDSHEGRWRMAKRLFTIELEHETLEFLVTGIEHGVAQTVDPDYNSTSVFMTEAAFKIAMRRLFED